jgi:hypothetical protein
MAKPKAGAKNDDRSQKVKPVATSYVYVGAMKILNPPEPIRDRKPSRPR